MKELADNSSKCNKRLIRISRHVKFSCRFSFFFFFVEARSVFYADLQIRLAEVPPQNLEKNLHDKRNFMPYVPSGLRVFNFFFTCLQMSHVFYSPKSFSSETLIVNLLEQTGKISQQIFPRELEKYLTKIFLLIANITVHISRSPNYLCSLLKTMKNKFPTLLTNYISTYFY